ncbi:MAG: phosphoribosylamine--glycine ligase [Proteobacteria bacterium]|nr:phosphoribosylamine--glycine ligase [Pseudomonadota bacterium]
MQVLIIGAGGREHALAWKIAQSANVSQVYVAPGNAGTATENKVENVDIQADNISGLVTFARDKRIELTIVGPEAPLVAGVVNVFNLAGLRCFGPRREAAELEGSKAYMKDFLKRHRIPTAEFETFGDIESASAYVRARTLPIVIKADGLAAGKGVVIAQSYPEALETVRSMLSGEAFGEAGKRIVVEEFLVGEEASFIVMTDGETVIPFASSQDHKARDDGDLGPNTGGMGAYTPAPIVDSELHARIIADVIKPTLAGMIADRRPYKGFLYAGLMIGKDGAPKVLEYNCRFGDPETQPIMVRLTSDLAEACVAVLDGNASSVQLNWDPRVALGVVIASGGYPSDYDKGHPISGLDNTRIDDAYVFHAGTAIHNNAIVNSGGRVLCVVGLGDTVSQAQQVAYARVDEISFDGAFCRRDIGHRAVAREA